MLMWRSDKKLSVFIEKEQKFNISKLNHHIQRITNLNQVFK